jgi:hypothetical protein
MASVTRPTVPEQAQIVPDMVTPTIGHDDDVLSGTERTTEYDTIVAVWQTEAGDLLNRHRSQASIGQQNRRIIGDRHEATEQRLQESRNRIR